MHALDARYHSRCLTALHNWVKHHQTESNPKEEESILCSGQELSRQEPVPCDHEEADTRILLHVLHCANHGRR